MTKKIGLALSGGGFRATLYHLGLVRFLHDAGILKDVSHITAVSGGSIIAAHLALNWNRYNASAREFDAAASELLAFVRLDVRNRIVRRYPLIFPLRGVRRLARLSNHKLTRTGLLEYHYEKYLYGDTSLFQLPENPRLHLLSTNLSEGRLCSFNRDGLWMVRRGVNDVDQIDRVSVGLATVPMAVAASSAFAGFFPPIILTGADVGASSGEFGRQAYTDGGVFDNLGVRMFHCLADAKDQLPWKAVLVSDAGRPFEIQSSMHVGGIIRTAMRASDILMDRVWQLETETFKDTPGFVFARITEVVDPEQDPAALHPEAQRQLPNIRTDLDRFSQVEISSLVRHGYCVGRKTCRAHPDVFGTELEGKPTFDLSFHVRATTAATIGERRPHASTARRVWRKLFHHGDKVMRATTAAAARAGIRFRPRRKPTAVTIKARTLHSSAARRIWSTLLDPRDWVSYVYVPIIIPILVLTPYLVTKYYERSQRINEIVQSLAEESHDLQQMTRLLDGLPEDFTGEKAEDLSPDDKADLKGFTILQGQRIVDLRRWKPAGGDSNSTVYSYNRMKVRKEPGNQANNFRVGILAIGSNTQVRFPPQQLRPKLYSRIPTEGGGEDLRHLEVGADFRKVPEGESVDVIYENLSRGLFLRAGVDSTSLTYDFEVDTIEQSWWLLMPAGKEYRSFQLVQYPTANPEALKSIKPVTEFLSDDFKILAFKLLGLKAGYTYELTCFYRHQ
jgi:predicted acylesterase/phospholipase RssA